MKMKSDIEIAQEAELVHIKEVAEKLGINEDELEFYGKYKAKISDELWESVKDREDGKLVLVTAINPTPAGEGKTTTSIGLGEAMALLGKKAVLALREPSLGPCFGIKGGAAGGGYAQVVPMEDLNLHFTGDFHAITSANNLLAALLDNHIQQGNQLGIDPRQVVWKRCMDMNDRALRNIVIGLGSKMDGMVREDHFIITVASEIMAVLCLADNMEDLKRRLGRIIVAYSFDGTPITADDLHATGSMAALLKDAIKPNLIQTLEHNPAIVHGGPFANIAHGCNSVRATKTALKLGDIAITEAGFGADLGAEKFFDIKCRKAGLKPDAVVLVATIRALKYNGGVPKADLAKDSPLEQTEIRQMLLNSYIADMTKYANQTDTVRIFEAYDSLPAQLAKDAKKFQYKLIKSGARASQYGDAIDWLIRAGIVNKCMKCSQGFYPVAAYQDVSAFKLYYSDMGIMSARIGMTLEALQSMETEHFRGILTENYVAIALKTNGYDLHYWESDNTAEVDFLIQKESHVIPVECKAGNHVKAKSMMVYMEKYNPSYAIRISTRNFGIAKGIKSVPLYSVFCI